MICIHIRNFQDWRNHARSLLAEKIAPHEIEWRTDADQPSLFEESLCPKTNDLVEVIKVPAEFVDLAKIVACHRSTQRWALLYSLLWRLTHEEKHLIRISTDPLVNEILRMRKQVGRDVHKMKAFVRFRICQSEQGACYIAWYQPDHRILKLAAPFFKERFQVQNWAIFTPDGAMAWDGTTLLFNEESITLEQDLPEDQMENLWQTYYRAIFNPARIKIKAMKREMPVRYWKNLPEAELITSMLQEAPKRVVEMLKHSGYN